jgi:hypothetical protein
MSATVLQGFRLTPTDIEILDYAQEQRALTSRTEALRYILRDWAEEVGFELKKPPVRKKGKKK